MLAASLNAFFCASPIYGSAEDFTFLLDVTVSREVTPAAKQQIGETRKKRLAKRLAFFRFDILFGIIKGEQPLIRGSSASKSLVVFWFSFDIKREQLALMQERSDPAHRRAVPLKLNQNTLPTAYRHFTRSSRYSGSSVSRLLMTTPPLTAAPVEWIYRPSPR